MDDNLVYENVGLPTIHGRHRAMQAVPPDGGPRRFEVKIHRIAADGAAVLTERTDALIFGPLRLQFWVCGVFEVHDGRITLWRDYFDFFDMLKATVRGLAGAGAAVAASAASSGARNPPSSSNACAQPTSRSVASTSSAR